MPSPTNASVSNGAPTQYDIVRMAAYKAARLECYDELLAQLTQYAIHSPVTERKGSREIADYLWEIVVKWQDNRPR